MRRTFTALIGFATAAVAVVAHGQTTTTYEDGPDGVKYQVTRQVVQKSIPATEYQTREQKVYRPQVTTQYQSYQQNYLTPVTQYQVVPHLRNWWNPFGEAYWTNDVEPVTRWESRPATVQVPVATTNWVEETQTAQVPVTTYRTVNEEHTSRVAVSVNPTNSNLAASSAAPTSVASRQTVGGQQYQSDPPKTSSPWATTTAPADPYRR